MKTFVLVLLLTIETNAQLQSQQNQAFGAGSAGPTEVLTTIISTSTLAFSSTFKDNPLVSSAPTSEPTPVVITSLVVTTIVTVVGTSSSTPSSQSAPPQSDTSGGSLSMGSIIGLSVAVGVAVIGLIAFLIWKLRRRCFSDFHGPDLNTHGGVIASEMSNTVPSPNVVNPFTVPPSNPSSTFLRQKHPSNGQSLPSQSIHSKFSHENQLSESEPATTFSNGGIPPLTPLRPQFSSISSSSLPRLLLSGAQANLDITSPRVPQVATEQRSSSPHLQVEGATANFEFVRHEDSGVRIPLARNNVVELPPLYTPG